MFSALDELLLTRKQLRLEAAHLDKKVAEYKKKMKAGKLKLRITWETDLLKMNFKLLRSKTIVRVLKNLPNDFEIVELNLEKVIKCHTATPDKFFPTNKLWEIRECRNTARLLEFIEQGNKLIPPIIRVLPNKTVIIIDGHYRIAVCRYLGLKKIPFIIRKRFVPNAKLLM